jgi:hypothetical protein
MEGEQLTRRRPERTPSRGLAAARETQIAIERRREASALALESLRVIVMGLPRDRRPRSRVWTARRRAPVEARRLALHEHERGRRRSRRRRIGEASTRDQRQALEGIYS